jgi:ribose/xylose/arabinose/galactoside ABC-type transport system permease subunit
VNEPPPDREHLRRITWDYFTSVLAILRDGFNIEGVSAFTFNMVLGSAIIAAMVLNAVAAKARIRTQSTRP